MASVHQLNDKTLNDHLYQADGTDDAPALPSLSGGECRCGYVFFPWQTYGCERCGLSGDALRPKRLTGKGTLRAKATVHRHRDNRALTDVQPRVAPFTIGVVDLVDGPTIRVVLDESDGPAHPDATVVARLVEVGTKERSVMDLCFAPTSGG